MNCEPCNSIEVTCNHNVTIGYLKELVGVIPSACCTTITVSGNDDYCPTYGELIGGSIIPSFVDGGNNSWSNNVDGITINGGYSSNQCVAKKDLKLIYTAFESLTVSNSSPTVSECGGSTTTTRTLTFRKYTKECDKSPTSTTQTDTTLRVTWSGTDGSNTGTKTYSRNTSFSDTHSSSVKCSISWRGCSHTSNTITVKQNVRRFDHYDDYSRSSGQSVSVTCYPITINCSRTTSYATATYYYTSWTERHSIDTCGYDYGQEIVDKRDNNSYNINSYLNATEHTFEECSQDGTYFTFMASYDGFSDSAVAMVDCVCETCPPANHTNYRDVTASCTSYSVRVNGTAYTYTGGELDESGNCINYQEHTATTSYNVNWNCSTIGGWIDPHVYVTGAPCCSGDVYVYDDVEVDCTSANSRTMAVSYINYHTNPDGSISEIPGTNNSTPIPAVGYNSTSSSRQIQSRISGSTLATARPRIVQKAGPCCPTGDVFTFDEVTVVCQGANATAQSVGYTQVHTNEDCTTTTTRGTAERQIPSVACNPNSSTRVIQNGNTGTTLSTANPRITQAAGPCCPEGDVFTFDDVTVGCSAAAATAQSVGYTQVHTNPDGTTTTTTGTDTRQIPAVGCNPTSSVNVIQNGNTATTLSAANPRITQAAGPCCPEGDVFTFDDVTVGCSAAAATAQSVGYTQVHTNPDGTTTTTTGTDTRQIPAVGCNPTSSVNVIQNGNTATTLSAANPRITQAAGPCCSAPCTCDDLVLVSELRFEKDACCSPTYSKSLVEGGNKSCIDLDSISFSTLQYFTAYKETDGEGFFDLRVYPNSANTSTDPIIENLTVTYNAVGGTNCSVTIELTQVAVECDCTSIERRITLYDFEGNVLQPNTTITVPLSGITPSQKVLIARGLTNGCGLMSARPSAPEMFVGGAIETVPVVENYEYEFYCSGITETTSYRSSGINISKETFEDETCSDTSFYIKQENIDPCSCSQSTIDSLELSSTVRQGFACYADGMFQVFEYSSCIDVWVITCEALGDASDWIVTGSTYPYGSRPTIGVYDNNTGEPRTGQLKCTFTKNGNMCGERIIDVTQHTCQDTCECGDGLRIACNNGTMEQEIEVEANGYNGSVDFRIEEMPDECRLKGKLTFEARTDCYPPGSDCSWIQIGDIDVEFYYIRVYFTVGRAYSNRLGGFTLYARVNGRECLNNNPHYTIVQNVADCDCDDAKNRFDHAAKTVSATSGTTTWAIDVPEGCYYQLKNSEYHPEPIEDWITFSYGQGKSSVIATYKENCTSQSRSVRIYYDVCLNSYTECSNATYALTLTQEAPNCYSIQPSNFDLEGGFTICGDRYGYDKAYFDLNNNQEAFVWNFWPSTLSCANHSVSLTPNVSDGEGIVTAEIVYYSTSLGAKEGYIRLKIYGNTFPSGYDSIEYSVYLHTSVSSTGEECDKYVGTFTLYKDGCEEPCYGTECSSYQLNVSQGTTAITVGNTETIGTITLPTSPCLKVEVETTSSQSIMEAWIEIDGSIKVKCNTSSTYAATVDIKVYDKDGDGNWNECTNSGSHDTINLMLNPNT